MSPNMLHATLSRMIVKKVFEVLEKFFHHFLRQLFGLRTLKEKFNFEQYYIRNTSQYESVKSY